MSNSEKTRASASTGPEDDSPLDGEQPEERAEAVGNDDDATDEADADAAEPGVEEQLAEMKDRWMRARAETENARRRARLDVEEARRHGASGLVASLLPVLDSLQRALEARPEDSHDMVWEGLQLTEQMLVGALAAHGVTPIEAKPGDAFDPTAHKALLEQPTADQEPGTIVAELVRGYRLHDRLLREAQVSVAKAPEDGDATPPAAD